jgi:large subunit ribosomal protein L13
MIIDANNLVLGRLASVAAKKALLGENIVIVNCEKAVIIGKKYNIFAMHRRKVSMGTHARGPINYRVPDRLVKRAIRGMLPYKQARGNAAFKRIKCIIGKPDEYAKAAQTIEDLKVSKNQNFVSIQEICNHLKGR